MTVAYGSTEHFNLMVLQGRRISLAEKQERFRQLLRVAKDTTLPLVYPQGRWTLPDELINGKVPGEIFSQAAQDAWFTARSFVLRIDPICNQRVPTYDGFFIRYGWDAVIEFFDLEWADADKVFWFGTSEGATREDVVDRIQTYIDTLV